MLEVILKKDIYRLGDRGEVVKVADGFARNYLYPQQLAIPATKGSLLQLEEMKSAAAREAVRLRGDAEKQAAALEGVVVRVVARAGQNNQLFGSVTNRDVAAKLAEQGIEVDRHRIDMKIPFRAVDDYEVAIRLYKDVSISIKVEVRAEGREDEPLTAPEEQAAETDAESMETDAEGAEGEAESVEAAAAETDAAESGPAAEPELSAVEAAEADESAE